MTVLIWIALFATFVAFGVVLGLWFTGYYDRRGPRR